MNQYAEFVGNHLFLSLSFLGLLTYWILGEIRNRGSGIGTVSPLDATQLINHNNAVVIDVREDKEITDGLIINSIHVPYADLSKQLKKRGFRFVGTTICYAFMQATGMVNDHIVGCFRYRQC